MYYDGSSLDKFVKAQESAYSTAASGLWSRRGWSRLEF